MRSGGTARKRAAAAGGTAIVTGVAAAAVGLFATPALAAAQSYDCAVTTSTVTTPVNFTLTVTVDGAVTNPPTAGQAVTLDNFQVHGTSTDPQLEALLTANNVDTATGAIDDFPVSATADDQTSDGSVNPGTDGSLPVNATVGTDGSLSFDTPASAISLTGFTANLPGVMTFTAGTFHATLDLSGPAADPTDPNSTGFKDTASVTCTGTDQFATTTVADKTPPPPPPGTGTGGAGKNPPAHPSPSPTPTHATAPVQHTTTTTTNTTSARPTLASTGAPYTIPMTATGAALLLLGGGMLVVGRRRRDLAIEGLADDGTTDGEPDAQD